MPSPAPQHTAISPQLEAAATAISPQLEAAATAPPTPPERRANLWHHPGFMRLWGGETASQFGAQIGALALSVLAVQYLHASAGQIGVLTFLQTAAFLAIGLPAGAWVDRWRKRRTMIAADLVRIVALVSVPIAWSMHALTLTQLMIVATVVGAGTVFFDAAYQSLVPTLVGRENISDANGKLEASVQIARIGGPGASGWLLGAFAAPIVYWFTAATYAVSAFAISRIPGVEPKPERSAETRLVQEIRTGLSYLRHEPIVGPMVACIAANALVSSIMSTLLPLLALRTLGMSAGTLGLIMSTGAIGGMIGVAARAPLTRRFSEGKTLVITCIAGSVVSLTVPLVILVPGNAALLMALAGTVASFFMIIFNVLQVSLRQRLCPPPLLGRLNASFRFVVWGSMAIGALVAGYLADAVGLLPAMLIGGIGSVAATSMLLTTRVWRLRSLPLGPGYTLGD